MQLMCLWEEGTEGLLCVFHIPPALGVLRRVASLTEVQTRAGGSVFLPRTFCLSIIKHIKASVSPSGNNAVNNINPPLLRAFSSMEEHQILLRQRQEDNKETCFFPC